MYYRVRVKSISGYEHFDLYSLDEYETAFEVVSAHYLYFKLNHPGDLIECHIVLCGSGLDPLIIKDFLKGE